MSSSKPMGETVPFASYVSPSPRPSLPGVSFIDAAAADPEDGLILLRQRLQMMCAIDAIGFTVFFTRQLLSEGVSRGFMLWNWISVFVSIALSAAIMSVRLKSSWVALRLVEALLFGVTAWFFAASIHFGVSINLDPENLHWAVFNVMSGMTWFCVLAFSYALVMPDSWRMSAGVVLCLVAVPLVVIIFERIHFPEFKATFDNRMLTLTAMMLATCGGAIIFSRYRFAQLQRDAALARLFGQYRLKQLIGRGGMGEVYLAEHRLLKRPCALKRIRPDSDGDPTTLARFEREVRATSELSHPHTVEIYDYGRAADGTFYYVMEYLWGQTLEDLVSSHGALPPARVVYLLRQVCESLVEAHANGLVHRDIKPSNIFAARRGGEYDFVKLLDFGLAKPIARVEDPALSQADIIVGSPLYMAPEQAGGGEAPDTRADIYSLGAVGYFLIAGRPPFVALAPFEVIIAHARDPVVPPSRFVEGIPGDVEEILFKCLAKDPRQRFPSIAALGESLANCSVAGQWTRADASRWWQGQPETVHRSGRG